YKKKDTLYFYTIPYFGSPSNVMLTKTCSGSFSCRKSAKTKFLQVIGQLKQPVQHYIYATTLIFMDIDYLPIFMNMDFPQF
ncbi:MAG: hypothetical protein ACKVTZ_04580, partial [Bacteroidia bacterium]